MDGGRIYKRPAGKLKRLCWVVPGTKMCPRCLRKSASPLMSLAHLRPITARVVIVALASCAALAQSSQPDRDELFRDASGIPPVSGTTRSFRPGTIPLLAAISQAFDTDQVRIVSPEWMSHAKYKVQRATDNRAPREALRQALEAVYSLQTHREFRPMKAWVMRRSRPFRLICPTLHGRRSQGLGLSG